MSKLIRIATALIIVATMLALMLVGQSARTINAAQSAQVAGTRVFLPIVLRYYPLPKPPSYWSESEYVSNPDTLKTIAQSLGTTDQQLPGAQDRLLVLDFGGQSKVSGIWGTRLIFLGNFITATKIVSMAIEFARYYWLYTGSDTQSHLTLGIGTNNYALPEGQSSADRGTEWARMLNEIKQKLDATPYKSQVTILGATDIEDWATYTSTSTWMQAYMDESTCVPSGYESKCLINFGNAHCPDVIGSPSDQCWGDWSMEETLLMASAIKRPADPYRFIITLPEIYNTGGANARQWANLSLWGVNHGYLPIWFAGTLTEWSRCQNPGVSCTGIDNPPDTGWCQLRESLITNNSIEQISFRWISDINWQEYAGLYQRVIQPCP